MIISKKSRSTAALLALTAATTLPATTASATWSILITDTRTGEVVLGSATCLTGLDLAISTPVVLTGIGAITAQSAVDINGNNRMFIRDRLLEGQPLSQILTELETFDPGHNNRQYGMITPAGDVLTYSGPQNADWAGGTTGRIEQGRPGPQDDIVYTVQGNILSGPNVVDDAVNAIINTDTDLPGKLMAAMLAARTAGGDGRCSCTNNNPTGCGSPPPGDFKSAHIGYMIGSRADDTDSIRAFYNLPANSTALTQLDNNQFAASDTDGNIHIYTNATNSGDQTAHFTLNQTIQTNLPNLTNLINADIDRPGLLRRDDLIAVSGDSTIAYMIQSTPGNFDEPIEFNVENTITALEPFVGFGPQDLIIVGSTENVASYQLKNNTLVRQGIAAFPTTALTIADLQAGQAMVMLLVSEQQIHVMPIAGNGNFDYSYAIDTSPDPVKIRAADINNDNLIDILVATDSSQVLDTFINTGTPENPTFAAPISSPLPTAAIDFQITDLNNDNIKDAIVLLDSGQNLRYYLGDNTGNFTETDRTRLGGTPTTALLADLNNDGDMDLITNPSDELVIYDNLQNATVQRRTGFARGDKFMSINIANQFNSAPDPVDQMLTRFEDFRASLTNKVDAVQTIVTKPTRLLIDDPNPSTPTIRIQLRDWQSNPITDSTTFTFENPNPNNPNTLTLGTPTLIAPGTYDIPVQALSSISTLPGQRPLKIRATTNDHTVTLMPSITINTTNNLADFNADTRLNFLDISLFINAFTAQSPVADLNNDTLFTIDDLLIFSNEYKNSP